MLERQTQLEEEIKQKEMMNRMRIALEKKIAEMQNSMGKNSEKELM